MWNPDFNIRALKKGELMINKNKENLVCDS